ncbi:hypothetical protein [Gloeothece verrucosa]|uniref:Uncharacterized protein n=1 Tax=Gloeothece verrucosa (strain PCC 7822) TaxID=497965 RepID=E0UJA0_GLOV7|nr:hypothetical protein [Gloeothece verrucosa]ADN15803.1 hypothetical protein Cyan7822_3872 [Gloeothece verrucosa PCC 7822]
MVKIWYNLAAIFLIVLLLNQLDQQSQKTDAVEKLKPLPTVISQKNNSSTMFENIPKRDIRTFYIYKNGVLTLALEDRPGTLHSMASPPPTGAPTHPFIHGSAYDAKSEDEMGTLLRKSTSFDNYINLLIEAGYDVVSRENTFQLKLEGGFRLEDEKGLVGALWNYPGQFTCIGWQPASGQLDFDYVTLTVYRQDRARELLNQLQSNQTFEALKNHLESLGFKLIPIPLESD